MKNLFEGKNILVGISGGIAAYKAADLTSRLMKLGAKVKVIMTENAIKFIDPLTFESLSENPVYYDTFQKVGGYDIEHIALAKWADLFIIVPATANIIGKAAGGIADDLLTTTILATEAKTIFAPAMNTVMYEKKVVRDNIEKLKSLSYIFVPPGEGRLACGDIGQGKLADIDTILGYMEGELCSKKDLRGIRVLVTAGPTYESIDPVRYIANRSSGKMGYALAHACALRGAEVDLVTGPTNRRAPEGVRIHPIVSATQMYEKVLEIYPKIDLVFKAAAVADYRVEEIMSEKIKKAGKAMELKLIQNPDILAELGRRKDKQILVGFAAETEDLRRNAIEKLKDKNLDFILANDVSGTRSGFDSDENQGVLYKIRGDSVAIPIMNKGEFAHRIIDEVVKDFLKD